MQPKRRFTDALGWVDHLRGISAREMYDILKRAGKLAAAGAVVALIVSDIDLDASAELVLQRYRDLANTIGTPDGGGAAVQFGDALTQYVREFSGQDADGTILYGTIIAYLNVTP